MRLSALAVQLQGFAHSTDNLAVGVSPRMANCWQKVWGGLIPTYKSTFSDLFEGWNAAPVLLWSHNQERRMTDRSPGNALKGSSPHCARDDERKADRHAALAMTKEKQIATLRSR